MTYTVEFAPQALEQLAALYRYIATEVSPETAASFRIEIIYLQCHKKNRAITKKS